MEEEYKFEILKSPGGVTVFYKYGWKVHSYEYTDDLFKEQVGKYVYLSINRILDECKCKKSHKKMRKIIEFLDSEDEEFSQNFKDFMGKINLFLDYFQIDTSIPIRETCVDYFRKALLKRDLNMFPDYFYDHLSEECEKYSELLNYKSKYIKHYKKTKSLNTFGLIFFIILIVGLLFAFLLFFIYRRKSNPKVMK